MIVAPGDQLVPQRLGNLELHDRGFALAALVAIRSVTC